MPSTKQSELVKPDESSPAVFVLLPAPLVSLFPDSARLVELSASSVAEMIDQLDSRWPGMRDRVCDSTPAIRPHINIYVEGERANLETRLPPGAEITVMTAISGG